VGATTLFATHYHDLTDLAGEREGVRNLHFTADRDGDDVTFLHRVAEGPASSSYGIEVARMAGVPDSVVDRARALVDGDDDRRLTNGHGAGVDVEDREAAEGERNSSVDAADATPPDDSPVDPTVAETLRAVDLATTTPIEALNLLADLAERVE
jgi:DNA mismatch repair protein MutS